MKENIKELEEKRNELDKKIKQYYLEEKRERISRNEEKYVGKCYKVEDEDSTTYFKILSGLTNNTYCCMHCIKFKLPINPEFQPIDRVNGNKFEYEFMGDLLDFDYVEIRDKGLIKTNKRIEIPVDEFENALKEFGKQLLELSRDNFSLNSKYFKD